MRNASHPLLPFAAEWSRWHPKTQRRSPTVPRRWRRHSLGEIITRLDDAYGLGVDRVQVAATMGISGADQLSPTELRALCDQLGVPPVDFGLDP